MPKPTKSRSQEIDWESLPSDFASLIVAKLATSAFDVQRACYYRGQISQLISFSQLLSRTPDELEKFIRAHVTLLEVK